MLNVLKQVKKNIPRWARIMRVQREISSQDIVAGPKLGNLRQIVLDSMKKEGLKCKCIRCREAGLANMESKIEDLKMNRENYNSSNGNEVFLSYDDPDDFIYGFLRLRNPSQYAHRKEIEENTCIVRELHVFGKSLKLGHNMTKRLRYHLKNHNLLYSILNLLSLIPYLPNLPPYNEYNYTLTLLFSYCLEQFGEDFQV